MADVVVSPDTRRADRLPPGQTRTFGWPDATAGEVPPFDSAAWTFSVFPVPLIDKVSSFTWEQFLALPRVTVYADFHSASGQSRFDNLWEGIPTRALLEHVKPTADAKFVMVHSEYGVSTNLPIADFFADDSLFALKHDGKELTPELGYPVRLVVPRLYSWKSAKWVRGVEFMAEDRPGYWEDARNGGHHMRGDPWREERR